MSIPDTLIYPYFELVTDVDLKELAKLKTQLENPTVNPRDLKKYLARTLVRMYHGREAASKAEAEFERIFVNKKLPEEIQNHVISQKSFRLDDLLIYTKTASSKSEARRLIKQGGVSIDGERVSDPFKEIVLTKEIVLKVGKRKFAKIRSEKV
jgi:tyrosyl-tRNA synthetase